MRALALIAVATLAAGAPTTSSAGVQEAIYDDVKDIITELMETEATRSVVPNAICRLDPAVHVYFRDTLQRVYDHQLGSLGPVVLDDARELLENIVLVEIDPTAAGPIGPGWTRIQRLRGGIKAGLDVSKCVERVKALGGPNGVGLDAVLYKDSAGNAVHTAEPPATAACSAPGALPLERWVACESARAIRAAVSEQSAAARLHLLRLTAAMSFGVAWQAEVTEASVAERTDVIRAIVEKDTVAAAPDPTADQLGKAIRTTLTDCPDAPSMAVNLFSVLHSLCAYSPSLPVCGAVDKAFVGSTEGLQGLIRAATGGDYVHVVEWLLAQALPREPEGEVGADETLDDAEVEVLAVRYSGDASRAEQDQLESGADETQRRQRYDLLLAYRRFLSALSAYAIEAGGGDSPSAATRGAFRAAAREVLLSTRSGRSGFDRRFGWNIIVPQLTLRASASAGYVGETDAGGLRFAAGLDWLVLRGRFFYSETFYMAGNVILTDPLAPFAEVASRRAGTTYNGHRKLWLNTLGPRVEMIVGMPALSRQLAFSIGANLRWVAPTEPVDEVSHYQYLLDDKNADGTKNISRHIEGALGLKYLF